VNTVTGIFGDNWIFVLEIFTGVISVAVGWYVSQLRSDIKDMTRQLKEVNDKLTVEIDAQARRVDAADLRLAEYKTYAVQTFATTGMLDRVDSQVEKLFDRIDAKLDRIEAKVDMKADKQ
jgi:hypothetical protein